MVGDLNADLSDRCSCLLNKLQFCDDNSLILSSHLLSPAESHDVVCQASVKPGTQHHGLTIALALLMLFMLMYHLL